MKTIEKIIQNQRKFFETNATKNIKFRKKSLIKFYKVLEKNKNNLCKALKKDLNRSEEETYLLEIYPLIEELKFAIKKIEKFSKCKKVNSEIVNFPAKSYIKKEPLGIVAIISTWNYPLYISLIPMISAISAGNCVILKLSEYTPALNKVIKKIINEVFLDEYVIAVDGEKEISYQIISSNIDYLFFTGSPRVAREISKAIAPKLLPHTFELGGKSPTIIDENINIELAARRLVFGKFINAGQTCVAPDYVLIHKNIKEKFIEALIKEINISYCKNEYYKSTTKIINTNAFNRLQELLLKEEIVYGGKMDSEKLVMQPTICNNVDLNSKIMQEEIFGPILPIIEIESIEEGIKIINSKPKPLTLYIFSNNKTNVEKIIENTSSGSILINDTIMQMIEKNLPFGGVGESGFGRYHGIYGFDTFSNMKSVMKRSMIFDLKIRYISLAKNTKKILKILDKLT